MKKTARSLGLRFMQRGVYCIPGPQKESSGGEDAFFCTSRALGMADGVGSWIDQGIDPALYPRKLMSACLVEARKTEEHLKKSTHGSFFPLSILSEAHRVVQQARVRGSTTAVVAAMLDEQKLGIINVGDSGLRIVRDGSLFFGTAEGTFSFNCPHQLGTGTGFSPENGEKAIISLRSGDVVVLATDGVFDNVFDDDLVKIVSQIYEEERAKLHQDSNKNESDGIGSGSISNEENKNENSPSKIAETLAKFAFNLGKARTGTSPFGAKAAQHNYRYEGGKPDDISVLVAVVGEGSEEGGAAIQSPFAHELNLAEEKKACPLLVEDFFVAQGKTLTPPNLLKRRSRL